MPVVSSTIPNSVLPQDLADPNRVISEYESYTLIPRLGPLAYFTALSAASNRLAELNATLGFLARANNHNKRFARLPSIGQMELSAAYNIGLADEKAVDRQDFDARRDGREIQLQGDVLLNSFRGLQKNTVGSVSGKSAIDATAATVATRIETESNQELLAALKKPNAMINHLVQSGRFLDSTGALNPELLDLKANEQANLIFDSLEKVGAPQAELYDEIAENMLANALPKNGATHFRRIADAIAVDDDLWKRLRRNIAGLVGEYHYFNRLNSLNDAPIVDSREWAYLRREEVHMDFGTPVFRGPVALDAVAPNSALTISDSLSTGTQTINATASTRDRMRGSNVILANQIKNKLGTLYDYGSNLGQTMSEQGFSRDTSRDEKRSLVEQTLSEISEANASQTVSSRTVDATSMREYRTEGKDTLRATSEVAFEAAVPVQVTHYLRGLGLVWCPRMENPFLSLYDAIEEHANQVEADYIRENYVPDPREPTPTFDGHARVTVNTDKVMDDDYDGRDGEIFEDTVTISLSEADRAAGYLLSRDVKCEFHQDDHWNTNAFETDQYRILDPVVESFEPNASITIHTRFVMVDEPNGPNPDSIWLSVSVTKYKETDAYKQQLADYMHEVDVVNPMRRDAVEAQARRYARLKKEELIDRYANNPDELRDFTFVSLMRKMFGNVDGDWSYYHGIIKSCIDWDKARLELEPADPSNLIANGLSPYHFLNVRAARFFLPLHEASEDAFFESVGNTLDVTWRDLFNSVQEYIDNQREIVDNLNASDDPAQREQIMLDQYDSELVLGRHLEAVLSKTDFLQE